MIEASALAGLAWQRADGSFPPGHNGPWGHQDTPVRVTAHWLVLLVRAFAQTGEPVFREAALRAIDYLSGPAARPGGFSFHCLAGDDPFLANNGLIGQAWALEALAEAGLALGHDCLGVAVEVAGQHRFEEGLGLWRSLGPEGSVGPVHQTLNQQLWFSVLAYRLGRECGHAGLLAHAQVFFDRLASIVLWRGRYMDMLVCGRHLKGGWLPVLWDQVRQLRHPREAFREVGRLREQSLGYLSFTLHGLALLHAWYPDVPLWREPRLEAMIGRSIAFADERIFPLGPGENRYAFSYNPTGIEMAFVKQQFGGGSRPAAQWLAEQLRRHYDPDRRMMTRDTGDEPTLAARLYELCRLNDLSTPLE